MKRNKKKGMPTHRARKPKKAPGSHGASITFAKDPSPIHNTGNINVSGHVRNVRTPIEDYRMLTGSAPQVTGGVSKAGQGIANIDGVSGAVRTNKYNPLHNRFGSLRDMEGGLKYTVSQAAPLKKQAWLGKNAKAAAGFLGKHKVGVATGAIAGLGLMTAMRRTGPAVDSTRGQPRQTGIFQY